MDDSVPYIPPGWLRCEKGGRIVFRTDRDSGRIEIKSRGQLEELRMHKNRFLGEAFRPDRLSFSRKFGMVVVADSLQKDVVENDVIKEDVTMEDVTEDHVTVGDVKEVRAGAGGRGEREEEKLVLATELLYVGVGEQPKHEEELLKAVMEMENIKRDLSNTKVNFNIEQFKESIAKAGNVEEVCEMLWNEPEVQKYFNTMENARILSEVLELSSRSDNPMTNPVPNCKTSTYAHLFFYGNQHCYSLMKGLVNLVKADKGPVVVADVVTVSFYFACLAHVASRINNGVARTKALLLRQQGLTEPGLSGLAKVGVTEVDGNLRKFRYMLADLGETHFASQVRAGLPYQIATDNLDKRGHHLTQAFAEVEQRDTRGMSTQKPPLVEIPSHFEIEAINLFSPQNKTLKDHMRFVSGYSIGRRLAAETVTAKVLGKHLPAHHPHLRSQLPNTIAIIIIKNPEYLQETKNAEFVEYLRREQWDFLTSVAESLKDEEKKNYLKDLATIKHASDMVDMETEEEVVKREKAESRVLEAVAVYGEWIGWGDALTFKMFWHGAKSLCQGAVTALERLDFLSLFRIGFLHLKFNKVYLEYGKMMPSKTNIEDPGTLAELKALLPGLDRISNTDKEISKCFEFHDQMFATTFQAKAGDAFDHYLKANPNALTNVKDQDSAVAAVLTFLDFYDIEFMFDPSKALVKPGKYDDLQQHDREGLAYWVLSILLDDAESEGDDELLEALELTLMLEFLNKNKSGAQTSKYSYFLLLDIIVKRTSCERSKERMANLCVVNPSGQRGGGLFRDKVNEHIVRQVKEILDALGISLAKDLDIQKMVASVTPATLITEHDLRSSGFPTKFKQHSADMIGKERTEMIRQHVAEVGTFRAGREKQMDFLHKFRGSPFYDLKLAAIKRFLERNKTAYFRKFPDKRA